MVEIKVSQDKCKSPLECALCLKICPTAVFYAYPQKMEMFKETPSDGYVLIPRFRYMCTLCYECVKVCPQGAIEIRA